MPVFYADASALVKLVREEPESGALRMFLDDAQLVSSELVLTEVPRAVRRAASDDSSLSLDKLLDQANELLDGIGVRPLDTALLTGAGAFTEPALRALDAIHVITAADVYPLSAFITYDERQATAARLAGLRTVAPGI